MTAARCSMAHGSRARRRPWPAPSPSPPPCHTRAGPSGRSTTGCSLHTRPAARPAAAAPLSSRASLEEEGIAPDDGLPVRARELPVLDLALDAALDRGAAHRRGGDLRAVHGAVRANHPEDLDLACERRLALQLLLVAVRDRGPVRAHHAIDLLAREPALGVGGAGLDRHLHLALLARAEAAGSAAAPAAPAARAHVDVAGAVDVPEAGAAAADAAAREAEPT